MTVAPITQLNVGLDIDGCNTRVGRLAIRDHKIYFEYEPAFIALGLNVSPESLPLQADVTTFDNQLFEGLPGLFNDSLPDGWG